MKFRLLIPVLLAGLAAACNRAAPDPVSAGDRADHAGHDAQAGHGSALAAGGLTITNAWARATVPGSTIGAVYFTVRNDGPGGDVLLSMSSPAAERIELHRTTTEEGVSRMRPAGAVEVGNGQSIVAEPGGLHVMLLGLRQPLMEGERVPLTLQFRNAGVMQVQIEVRPIATGALRGQTDSAGHTDRAGQGDRTGRRGQRHVTT